ncbi:MAG TPA: hypothetical protein VF041_05450 [Gemmatimonadaceae bacterium]
MTANDAHAGNEELQFDRVASRTPTPDQASPHRAVVCAACSTPIQTYYFHVNGKVACSRCRNAAESKLATPTGLGPMARATALGIGAAIAGAVVYYGVIAITEFEIGIVAILIGYMVGWAVRKGAAGRGGRRFQVLAAILTYWSVGLAYTPIAMKGATGDHAHEPTAAAVDSARTATSASMPDASGDTTKARAAHPAKKHAGPAALLSVFFVLLVFVFALPIIAIVGSLPSGLISAFIIFIGLRQAWRMTAGTPFEVSGPYRVGVPSPAAG